MILDDYLNLITSEHRLAPKYIAMISAQVSLLIQIQDTLQSMIPKFDVDLAVGDQQDILGQWIGVSRNVNIPVAGIYFTWDGDATEGWDYGTWSGGNPANSISKLPDDAYRTLLKAKIAANNWDGTTEDAYRILEEVFPTVVVLIQDHMDMSYDVALVGGIVDSLTVALLTGGYIPLKPEGVRINTYYFPVDNGPVFGWDLDTAYVKGWDTGSWAIEYTQ